MLKKLKLSAQDWVLNHRKRFAESNAVRKLAMCKKCYTFYYKNSWHFDKPLFLETDAEEEIPVRFTECPACLEQDSISYEMEMDLVLGRV